MLVDNTGAGRLLRQIVCGMTRDRALREDLLQEALVHLWQQEAAQPGQRSGWYLQSCRFFLQNLLRHGRSIDSHGRRYQGVPWFDGDGDSSDEAPEANVLVAEAGAEGSLSSQVGARDIVQSLSRCLTVGESATLARLADGQRPCDIARALGVSHTCVNRHRVKIAALAIKLGIDPLPSKTPATHKTNRYPQAPRRPGNLAR